MSVDVSATLPGHIPFERVAQVLRDAGFREVVSGDMREWDEPGIVRTGRIYFPIGRQVGRFMRVHHFVGADAETQPNMVPYPRHTYAVMGSFGGSPEAMRALVAAFGGYFEDEAGPGTRVWAEPTIEAMGYVDG